MLNYIWFALMAIALVVAIFTGTAPAVTKGAIDSAKTGVDIALGLVGIMTLWLGIMRVAEKAGLITMLGRLLRPFSRLLFPDVPPEHPAIGAMIMNVAANMLGLANAATPLGIKAMEELQTLNDGDKETATNAMVTFMALNTAGIQFIPATIIGVLAAAGAKNPTAIIVTTIVATLSGATAAVLTARILQRFFPRREEQEQVAQ
jgi:spore maturation protein A